MSQTSTAERTAATNEQSTDWSSVGTELAARFAETASEHDANDRFVSENYAQLRASSIFSAGVPAELGGGGARFGEVCDLIRTIAHGCGSTALALSMHAHLVASTVWRFRQGQAVNPLLERIAGEQLVLISTGASDWLESSGTATAVDGGFRVNGRKVFASGCLEGGMLVTSACYDDPNDGATVLHFPVPFSSDGVRVVECWETMSMRATGSHNVLLEDVFVPDKAVALRRPQGKWHPFFNVVVAVAMPIVMSAYVGVAESAAALARRTVAGKKHDPHLPYLLGEMENALTSAQMAWREMVAINDDFSFEPVVETASRVLIRKTIAAKAVIETAEKAMEAVGGRAIFRDLGLERMLRDVHGAPYHPLPEKRQHHFTGRLALGLDPIGNG